MAEITQKGKGLQPLTFDPRDFHHSVVFGALAASDIPTHDFFVSHPLVIKDQKDLQFCTAFATSSVVEDEVGVELDPISAYAWACKLLNVVDPNGHNLRDAAEEACKIGFIEQAVAPFKLDSGENADGAQHAPADFLSDWKNYSEDFLPLAWENARISYFRVDTGPHDTFDNIRAALFQNIDEHRSVIAGTAWHDDWTGAPKGIIPETYSASTDGGHAIKIFGQITLDGESEPRLIVQNSWGPNMGDGGLYYFPRSVVNKEFTFGAFNFKNLAPAKAAFYAQNGITVNASLLVKMVATIVGIITSYF